MSMGKCRGKYVRQKAHAIPGLFGEKPEHEQAIRLMSNSDNTQSTPEADYKGIIIRSYLKNKVRVQGKARNGEKAEHTR